MPDAHAETVPFSVMSVEEGLIAIATRSTPHMHINARRVWRIIIIHALNAEGGCVCVWGFGMCQPARSCSERRIKVWGVGRVGRGGRAGGGGGGDFVHTILEDLKQVSRLHIPTFFIDALTPKAKRQLRYRVAWFQYHVLLGVTALRGDHGTGRPDAAFRVHLSVVWQATWSQSDPQPHVQKSVGPSSLTTTTTQRKTLPNYRTQPELRDKAQAVLDHTP